MDLKLAGKRVLVTGASKGIGRAVADVLAAEGCDLVLVARTEIDLSTAADAIRSQSQIKVEICAADLSTSEDQQRIASYYADVDIVVNNAGSNPAGGIEHVDEQTWRAAWDLKVFGYINLCRAFYSAMKERGHGVIINIIGTGGERLNEGYILGASGNIALMGLTKALGGRSPDFGVRVVGVNPGLTRTERGRHTSEGLERDEIRRPGPRRGLSRGYEPALRPNGNSGRGCGRGGVSCVVAGVVYQWDGCYR